MPEGADCSWYHPAPLLRKQKQIQFSIFACRQKQLYGIASAVHHASSHKEKKLGGACNSCFRITVQLR